MNDTVPSSQPTTTTTCYSGFVAAIAVANLGTTQAGPRKYPVCQEHADNLKRIFHHVLEPANA